MDDRALRATIGLSIRIRIYQLLQSFGPEIEKEEWFRYERGLESIDIHYFTKS